MHERANVERTDNLPPLPTADEIIAFHRETYTAWQTGTPHWRQHAEERFQQLLARMMLRLPPDVFADCEKYADLHWVGGIIRLFQKFEHSQRKPYFIDGRQHFTPDRLFDFPSVNHAEQSFLTLREAFADLVDIRIRRIGDVLQTCVTPIVNGKRYTTRAEFWKNIRTLNSVGDQIRALLGEDFEDEKDDEIPF